MTIGFVRCSLSQLFRSTKLFTLISLDFAEIFSLWIWNIEIVACNLTSFRQITIYLVFSIVPNSTVLYCISDSYKHSDNMVRRLKSFIRQLKTAAWLESIISIPDLQVDIRVVQQQNYEIIYLRFSPVMFYINHLHLWFPNRSYQLESQDWSQDFIKTENTSSSVYSFFLI